MHCQIVFAWRSRFFDYNDKVSEFEGLTSMGGGCFLDPSLCSHSSSWSSDSSSVDLDLSLLSISSVGLHFASFSWESSPASSEATRPVHEFGWRWKHCREDCLLTNLRRCVYSSLAISALCDLWFMMLQRGNEKWRDVSRSFLKSRFYVWTCISPVPLRSMHKVSLSFDILSEDNTSKLTRRQRILGPLSQAHVLFLWDCFLTSTFNLALTIKLRWREESPNNLRKRQCGSSSNVRQVVIDKQCQDIHRLQRWCSPRRGPFSYSCQNTVWCQISFPIVCMRVWIGIRNKTSRSRMICVENATHLGF